jgi:hypothetical protein
MNLGRYLTSAYLDTRGAAEYLSVSPGWLESLRVRGGGPEYTKAGRRVIYAIHALDTWAETRRRRSTRSEGGAPCQ